MTRFEKIVLEQTIRKGNMGVRKIDGPLSSRTAKYFTNPDDLVTSFYYVDKHGKGTKYTPLTSNELVQRWLPTLFELQKYNTKDYIIILDTDSQVTGNTESVWDVFVANRNSLSKILDTDIKKLGKVGFAPLISLSEFQKLKNQNKNTNLKPAVTVGDLEQELEKKKPAIEKTKETVQNIVKGTETIDPNNLGIGTDDADAFQELLYQVGLKLIPTSNIFKKFAYWRTKGTDGGWDGEIGVATLNMLDKLSLKDKYKSGDIAGVIKDLRGSLLTTESTNYFKGTGMNIKLKDLLREQIIIKPDDEVTGGGTTNTTNTTNTKKKTSSTNFTQATFPSKYNGSGTITYNNGDKFTGSWVNGLKSGKGKFTIAATKTTVEGEWVSGKKNGIITYTLENGTSTQQTWKDGIHQQTNEKYWDIAVAWVKAEYNFWEGRGSGPKGQARPKSKKEMFDQFNSTGFGNFIGDDDEYGAASAYLANRKIALEWLERNLQGSVEVTGQDYYTRIYKWIYEIVDSIDDVFQNNCTVTLTNDAAGDTITRTVQGEIDVDW